jgi:NAD(P)-dependent dehydrogenase (short-subunit alcohol dehydrogenase family)
MKIAKVVALVTGANRGIGKAFVEGLLAAGAAKVYAAARDPSTVTVKGAEPIALDVTNARSVAAAAERCKDVALLVNNAGIARMTGFLHDDAIATARAELETNYFGPLAMSRAFAPVLAANGGGAIVNMLSVASWISSPALASYAASKSAAWSLTNGLRHELRGQGTRLIGVHVGFVDTDMASVVTGPKTSPAEVVRQVLEAIEAGRDEVLADEITRNVKRGLSEEAAVYLQPR